MSANIFADSFLETSRSQRARRGWVTFTSFGLEAVVIGLLLLIPLLRTVGAPIVRRTVSTPISAGRPEPPSMPHPRTGNSAPAAATAHSVRFLAPGHIPQTISMTAENTTSAPSNDAACTGICSSIDLPPGAGGPGIPFSTGGDHPIMPSLPPRQPTREFVTSKLLEGSLVRKVTPAYPPLAKTAHIQGPVVMFALISKAGTIENLRLLSGHPMLVQAAMDAVKQWQYRPYILNQQPIEVETQITVNFVLGN